MLEAVHTEQTVMGSGKHSEMNPWVGVNRSTIPSGLPSVIGLEPPGNRDHTTRTPLPSLAARAGVAPCLLAPSPGLRVWRSVLMYPVLDLRDTVRGPLSRSKAPPPAVCGVSRWGGGVAHAVPADGRTQSRASGALRRAFSPEQRMATVPGRGFARKNWSLVA